MSQRRSAEISMYHIPVLIPYTISTSTIESVLCGVRGVSHACEQK